MFPVWVLILLSGKKFRAGFQMKCGFWPSNLVKKLASFSQRPVWFHAVSVGETLAVADLVKEFNTRNPDLPIVFSTVTYTGQQIARKKLGDISEVIYFPFDIGFVTSKVIKYVMPQVVVIVETEIWPGFIGNLAKENIPVILINGRLSPKSSRHYKAFRFFFQHILKDFARFLMQAEIDKQRLIAMGAIESKAQVTGNIKYDIKASFSTEDIDNLKNELTLSKTDKVLIAGSTHHGEEEAVLEAYINLKELFPELKLILVPRHPERYEEVIELLASKNIEPARRSRNETFEKSSVFMLDTMGELSGFYSIADIAFIGGSLIKKGGHNPLEPAVYSVPVIVGPHTFNFVDITKLMVEGGAAIQVQDSIEFKQQIEKLLSDKNYYNQVKDSSLTVFDANRGATEETLSVIQSYLDK